MTGRARWGVVVALVLTLGACSTGTPDGRRHPSPRPHPTASPTGSTTPTGSPTAAPLAYGPGPQAVYHVAPQPPAGSCHYRHEGIYPMPDPACTPGALSPAVTPANIRSTICRAGGYTSTVRPPLSVTGPEKTANARSYGYTGSMATGEYDHLVALALGGDPDDPRNLWVEPNDRPGATSTNNGKDAVELAAAKAVCAGTLPLAQAQLAIATDWPALGRRLGVLTSAG